MLKLKGQTESGEWLLFGITELFHDENGCFRVRVDDVGLFAIDPATIQPADDPRKAMSEQEVLTRVQAMGEESLSPDNFEGLMRALEALKTTRHVDGDRVDPGAELATLREQVKLLREALALAKGFIKNGLDLGYINPPESGDAAYDTLPTIYKALNQTKPREEEE